MPDKYWEDFTAGEVVESMAITVTESHVVQWAGLTLDFYPIHVNEEYAKASQFGQRLVHGPLTFAMGVGLMYQTGWAKDSVIAWLGADDMQLPRPVFIGDTIRLRAEVVELGETSKRERGTMRMHYVILNQDDDEVMSYDMRFLMHRKGLRVAE
jgi:acyl dehydratase